MCLQTSLRLGKVWLRDVLPSALISIRPQVLAVARDQLSRSQPSPFFRPHVPSDLLKARQGLVARRPSFSAHLYPAAGARGGSRPAQPEPAVAFFFGPMCLQTSLRLGKVWLRDVLPSALISIRPQVLAVARDQLSRSQLSALGLGRFLTLLPGWGKLFFEVGGLEVGGLVIGGLGWLGWLGGLLGLGRYLPLLPGWGTPFCEAGGSWRWFGS
jgi:hypothetical protein